MKALSTLLKENVFNILRFLWPLVLAASLFYLDGRYLQKDDFKEVYAQQQIAFHASATEQKDALNKLTVAITTLADQQRINNENLHVLVTRQDEIAGRFDRHEATDGRVFDVINRRLERLESRK